MRQLAGTLRFISAHTTTKELCINELTTNVTESTKAAN